MLAARAGRPVDVDLEIAVGNLDVDLLRFRQHRDRSGGGVDAAAAFGDGDALDAVDAAFELQLRKDADRSEEHTSELQSLMRISYAVFCLKKKKQTKTDKHTQTTKTQ